METTCPNCGRSSEVVVKDGRRTCRHCGSAVSVSPSDETMALTPAQIKAAESDRSAAEPAPPRQSYRHIIEGYELISKLGEGGMGGVFLARQKSSGRKVALKVLRRELARDEEYVTRLVREATLASKLEHPNIVRAFETGRSNGQYYLVMEFADGLNLHDMLKTRSSLKEKEALEIVLQVARALAYAHSEGIVHRDIKPDNIIVDSAGHARLADLGLAKQVDSESGLTQTGTTMGTPDYMSPEQARGEKNIDTRSDIYSLGATLFHLVTGRPPFEGPSPGVVIAKRLTDIPPRPSEVNPTVSAECDRLIGRMLAPRPEDRHQTPQDLVIEMESMLSAGSRRSAARERERPRRAPGPAGNAAAEHLRRARDCYLAGDFRQAERAYSAALGQEVDCRDAWVGQVLMLLDMGRVHDGLTWADRALARFKADPELLAAKSLVLRRLGQGATAEHLCEAALGGGGGALAWCSRGEGQLASGGRGAAESFAKAIGAAGDPALARLRAAGAYLRHGRGRDALSVLTPAVPRLGGAALAHFTMGSAQEQAGLLSDAGKSYRRAVELAPGNRECAAALLSLRPSIARRVAGLFRRMLGR